jgi:oxaloacetate decarboxylase gamma subunit
MTIAEMLEQSAILTVLGMAVVCAFLWLMILCMNGTARLIRRMGLDRDLRPPESDGPQGAGGTVPPETAAAISAAVTEYRKEEGTA